jgi:hypothetical protein
MNRACKIWRADGILIYEWELSRPDAADHGHAGHPPI